MGKAGRNFVRKLYDWENNADLMHQHYLSILKK